MGHERFSFERKYACSQSCEPNWFINGKKSLFGTNLMQQLLQNEGIEVKNNQVTNFKNIFWDPTLEL